MSAQNVKKEINLLPKEYWEKGLTGRFLRWTLNVGRYVVVFTELIVISAFLYRFGLDQKLTDIKEEVNNKKAVISAYGDFEEKFRRLQLQLQTISGVEKESVSPTEVLEEISQMTPIDTAYSTISVNEDEVRLEGETLSDVGLATLLAKTQSSSMFTGVALEHVASTQDQNQAIEFQMVLSFKETAEEKK